MKKWTNPWKTHEHPIKLYQPPILKCHEIPLERFESVVIQSEAWAPQQEILCGRISLQVQFFFCAGCCQPATLRYSQWLMLSTTCWLVHSSKSLFRLVCLKIGNPPNPMLHHRFFRNNKQFHAICRYPRMLRGSQPEEVAALSKDHLRDVLSSVSTVGG